MVIAPVLRETCGSAAQQGLGLAGGDVEFQPRLDRLRRAAQRHDEGQRPGRALGPVLDAASAPGPCRRAAASAPACRRTTGPAPRRRRRRPCPPAARAG